MREMRLVCTRFSGHEDETATNDLESVHGLYAKDYIGTVGLGLRFS